jgi:hypothetical protein
MSGKRSLVLVLTLSLILVTVAVQCGPAPTPEVIEKVVKETVVVEKEVVVEVEKEVEVVVTPTPAPAELPCVDFYGYPDNAKPGRVFEIRGVRFTALGANEPFVNDVATGVHGLAFDQDGIQIDLPRPASVVTLTAGSWTPEPLEITALDGDGNVVDQTTVPGDNSVHTIKLTGQGIASVVITGGGREGVLVEICADTIPEPGLLDCVDFEDLPLGTEYGVKDVFVASGVQIGGSDFQWSRR